MHAKPLVLGLALLLAACGGGAASPTVTPPASASSTPNTPAQPPSSSPSPPLVSVAPVTSASSSPAQVSAPPAGSAQQPSLTITNADEGKTFNVRVGAVLDVDLQADSGMQPWQLQNPPPAILQAIPNPAAAAAQGVTLRSFKAVGPGTVSIMAQGRPACNPGQPCPQFIRAWRATITVTV